MSGNGRDTDLYSILLRYAYEKQTPLVGVNGFITYLERNARRIPEWRRWTDEKGRGVFEELLVLAGTDKCRFRKTRGESPQVFLSDFYAEPVRQAYAAAAEDGVLPFPDEASFSLAIPEEYQRVLAMGADFAAYLDESQSSKTPAPGALVLKLVFPGNLGNTYVLPDMIPGELLDAALEKVSAFLRDQSNGAYFLNKLFFLCKGKGPVLRQYMERLLADPMEARNSIQEPGEFSYLFWFYLCNALYSDLQSKSKWLPEESAVLQGAGLVAVFSNYYRQNTKNGTEAEGAFRALEGCLERAPFIFSMNDITGFTGLDGRPLLGQYTVSELEDYLNAQTKESGDGKLPDLLVINVPPGGETRFVRKSRLLPLCIRFLVGTRGTVRNAVLEHWTALRREFKSEPAMEADGEFEKLLQQEIRKIDPELASLPETPVFRLVYREVEEAKPIPEAHPLFYPNGTPRPLETVLRITRKDTLTDIKNTLPFWYSVPLIVVIARLFKKSGKRRQGTEGSVREEGAPGQGGRFENRGHLKGDSRYALRAQK
ncbi:MAG: hypothetical protein LBT16_06565 [Treponema sp.]|jgi:hypothetical protein|nr:hypothetical protein [Treponema sp.]